MEDLCFASVVDWNSRGQIVGRQILLELVCRGELAGQIDAALAPGTLAAGRVDRADVGGAARAADTEGRAGRRYAVPARFDLDALCPGAAGRAQGEAACRRLCHLRLGLRTPGAVDA